MTNPSSGDDPRIEEMTADQPAIRADERTSVPGLSVCVAHLAAIRQLADKRVEMHAGPPLRPYVFVSDILAVLDGVPGTTQQSIEDERNGADL